MQSKVWPGGLDMAAEGTLRTFWNTHEESLKQSPSCVFFRIPGGFESLTWCITSSHLWEERSS